MKATLPEVTFAHCATPAAVCVPDIQPANLGYYLDTCGCGWTLVKEKEHGKRHDIYDGAPSEWAALRGATHTLYCGEGPGRGTRPARLLATVLYVGVDEVEDGGLRWEKWSVKHQMRREPRA